MMRKVFEVLLLSVGSLVLLFGLLAIISPKAAAQVRGITAAQMSNLLGTTSYDYFNPVIKGAYSPTYDGSAATNIGILTTESPATYAWTGTELRPKPRSSNKNLGSAGIGKRYNVYSNAHDTKTETVRVSSSPATDVGADLGTSSLRWDDVHADTVNATETQPLCSGGPTGATGQSLCLDPDDPLGPAWKVLVGSQTYYVQISTVHP